jgi:superfamily II DNA or RNA helicase
LSLEAVGPGRLREAQVGPLLALAAHATVSDEPAQLVLPTGVGKTAIATLAPYLLGARKVLVVVPGRLTRGQINKAFLNPHRARSAGVLPANSALPKVALAENRATAGRWADWGRADVVVGTPSVLSGAHKAVEPMPRELFDLVIFDEAHHLPATTWTALLKATDARAVLLTATPLRNDGKRLPGKTVYTYPLTRALDEGVFGEVSYEPVEVPYGVDRDIVIARAACERLLSPEHIAAASRLLVRTSAVDHAKSLEAVYAELGLPLGVIVHDTSWSKAESMRVEVESGELLGFICVGALTEGFDFPALKVGAYHVAHKTLGPTIQFIGRLARPGEIGAVLVAPRDEVTNETSELYREDVGWQKLLPELVDSALERERDVREFVERAVVHSAIDVAPLSITPSRSVHICRSQERPRVDVDLRTIAGSRVVQSIFHAETSTAAFVTQRIVRPQFMRLDVLDTPVYELHLVTWVENEGVLLVSTTTAPALRDLLSSIAPGPRTPLSGLELRRLVDAANLERFFSIGKRAMQAGDTSYVTSAGRKAEEGITPADARVFDLGHALGRSADGLFGFSVRQSKIWQPGAADSLFGFRSWCEGLAREVANAGRGHQPTKLDQLSIPDPLLDYPANPLVVILPPGLFVSGTLLTDGEIVAPELLEFEPLRTDSSASEAVFDIQLRGESRGQARFATSGQVRIVGADWRVRIPDGHGHELVPLEEFLVHEHRLYCSSEMGRERSAIASPRHSSAGCSRSAPDLQKLGTIATSVWNLGSPPTDVRALEHGLPHDYPSTRFGPTRHPNKDAAASGAPPPMLAHISGTISSPAIATATSSTAPRSVSISTNSNNFARRSNVPRLPKGRCRCSSGRLGSSPDSHFPPATSHGRRASNAG